MSSRSLCALACLCAALLPPSAVAVSEPAGDRQAIALPAYRPQPYRARYRVEDGSRRIEMKVSLTPIEEEGAPSGSFWSHTSEASILFWKLVNAVAMRRVGEHFQPLHASTRFGKRKQSRHYDWEEGQLVFTDQKGEQTDIELLLTGQESVTLHMEVAARLAAATARPGWQREFHLMEGREARDWKHLQVRFAGTERISTEAGTFDCVRLDTRRLDKDATGSFWLAPEQNWVLVRSEDKSGDRRWELLKLKFTGGEE